MMKAIGVVIIGSLMTCAVGQMMQMGGMPPMGSFMAMGNMNGDGGMFGDAWKSFEQSFKNMNEAFKNMRPIQPWDQGMFGNAWKSFGESFKNMADAFKNMKPIQSWHKGENVCTSEMFRNDPFAELIEGQPPGAAFETCRENGFKVVCVTNMVINGKTQDRIRIYQCCPGFVGVMSDRGKICVAAV